MINLITAEIKKDGYHFKDIQNDNVIANKSFRCDGINILIKPVIEICNCPKCARKSSVGLLQQTMKSKKYFCSECCIEFKIKNLVA